MELTGLDPNKNNNTYVCNLKFADAWRHKCTFLFGDPSTKLNHMYYVPLH